MLDRGSGLSSDLKGDIVNVTVSFYVVDKGLHNGVSTRNIVPSSFFLHTSGLGHREDVPDPQAPNRHPDVEEGVGLFLRRGGDFRAVNGVVKTPETTTEVFQGGKKRKKLRSR